MLRDLRPEYDPESGKTVDCACVLETLEQAEDRAERQLVRRKEERNAYGAPSTTMFLLTREIKNAAKRR